MDEYELSYDEIITETDMAWLFDVDGDEVWIPKSQGDLDESVKSVLIPEWLAVEKELM